MTMVLRGLEITYIGVIPKVQKKGIGCSLILHFLELYEKKGINKCWVKTHSSNTLSNKLYKKIGFNLIRQFRTGKILHNVYCFENNK